MNPRETLFRMGLQLRRWRMRVPALFGVVCLLVSPLTQTFGLGLFGVGSVGTARAQAVPKSLRSLEPERMAPPPTVRTRRHRLRAPLMVLVATICSAPIGNYFWTGDGIPPSQPVPAPQMTSLGPQTTAQSSVRPQDLQQPVARDDDRGTLVQGEVFSQRPETSRQRGSSEGDTVATLQP